MKRHRWTPWILAMAALLVAGRALLAVEQSEPLRQGPRRLDPREHRVGQWIPDVAVSDLDGRQRRLSDFRNRRALVVAFTDTTCPVAKRYAPTLARLEERYAREGVAFLFVNPSAADTAEAMRAAARSHGFDGPYVHDPRGVLRSLLQAETTTEVFVLDAARTLRYRGAVDDQYGLAYALPEPRRTYLIDALDAVLAGREPPVAATSAPGCLLDRQPAETPKSEVTYHNRISRLVQRHCVECHRRGGVAPFSLESYADVASRREMIRFVVEGRRMPPWFAAPLDAGKASPWANDRSLTAEDRRALVAWLTSGHPEGDPADAPLPRRFATDWQIGPPDAIVQLPEPVRIPAEGVMPYINLRVPTDLGGERWVEAIEIQPTAREQVHHVLVFALPQPPPGEALPLNLEDPAGVRKGFFAIYVPGNDHVIYPEGMARRLPAGATLHFQLHYTPNGTAASDQTRIGLRFAKQPPAHEVRVAGAINAWFAIPPRAENHRETAILPVPFDVHVLALMPHMHVRGKAFRFDVVFPDGRRERLLDVPRYDFNWQLAYRYAEPVPLPAGARIETTAWYDNSAGNPANPDPDRTVRWGAQTFDEMLIGYVEYCVPRGASGEWR